jgi:proteic killer suppression protein
MIRTYLNKTLDQLSTQGTTKFLRQEFQPRLLILLDALNQAESLDELRVVGFQFDTVTGEPERYRLRVRGAWHLTFRWNDGDAWDVDFQEFRTIPIRPSQPSPRGR